MLSFRLQRSRLFSSLSLKDVLWTPVFPHGPSATPMYVLSGFDAVVAIPL